MHQRGVETIYIQTAAEYYRATSARPRITGRLNNKLTYIAPKRGATERAAFGICTKVE